MNKNGLVNENKNQIGIFFSKCVRFEFKRIKRSYSNKNKEKTQQGHNSLLSKIVEQCRIFIHESQHSNFDVFLYFKTWNS